MELLLQELQPNPQLVNQDPASYMGWHKTNKKERTIRKSKIKLD